MRATRFVALVAALLVPAAVFAADPPDKDAWKSHSLPYKDQFLKADVNVWLATLFPKDAGKEASAVEQKEMRAIFARLMLLVQYAGVEYRKTPKVDEWKPFPHPTAAVFSHGGRLFVVVPASTGLGPFSLWNWVLTGDPNGEEPEKHPILKKRLWKYKKVKLDLEPKTTEIFYDPALPLGVEEKWVTKTDIRADEGYFGLNVPIGGYGAPDAAGGKVDDEGSHGHLLMYYRIPPKDEKEPSKAAAAYLFTFLPQPLEGYMGKADPPTSHLFDPKLEQPKSAKDLVNPPYPPFSVSLTGGSIWKDLKCVKPGDYACLRIVLDSKATFDKIVAEAPKAVKNEAAMKKLLKAAPKEELEAGE